MTALRPSLLALQKRVRIGKNLFFDSMLRIVYYLIASDNVFFRAECFSNKYSGGHTAEEKHDISGGHLGHQSKTLARRYRGVFG